MNETKNRRYYRGLPMECGLGETQNERAQIVVRFDITTADVPEHSLTWYGHFTDATTDRTIESLRICGWQGDDLSDVQLDSTKEVELVVEEEFYNEEWKTKVQFINRAGGLALRAPLTGDKAKAFAASMRNAVRAFDAAKPEFKAAASRPASSTQARPTGQAAPRTAAPSASRRAAGGGSASPEPPPLTDSDFRGTGRQSPIDDVGF